MVTVLLRSAAGVIPAMMRARTKKHRREKKIAKQAKDSEKQKLANARCQG